MVNQDLLNYILTEEAQGYSPQQLKSVLISQGWNPGVVEEAIKIANMEDKNSSNNDLYNKLFNNSLSENVKKERPKSVTVISILFIIGGCLSIVNGIIIFIRDSFYLIPSPIIEGVVSSLVTTIVIISIILGCFNIFVGWGLWNLKNWARVMSIIFSALMLLTVIGIPIGVIIIYLLLKKDVKVAFINRPSQV